MKYFGQIENIFRIGQDRFTHIFGSFQDSKKGSQGHMRFTANIKIYWGWGGWWNCALRNKRLQNIFWSTFHPSVIVLYFYRAHEYKFSEKLAVVATGSLNFWQWRSFANIHIFSSLSFFSNLNSPHPCFSKCL